MPLLVMHNMTCHRQTPEHNNRWCAMPFHTPHGCYEISLSVPNLPLKLQAFFQPPKKTKNKAQSMLKKTEYAEKKIVSLGKQKQGPAMANW